MCGVGGFLIVPAAATRNELEARLWRMMATLRHRGPDDEGVWTDGRAGLAHARLSIIDLSPAGHQPMVSADGSAWITYNGEIYNFAEIRQEFEALGYPFRSRSDTEVIVNGCRPGDPKFSHGCAACSPSPFGTGAHSAWSWRAIGSGKSRYITLPPQRPSCSAPK